MFLTNIVSGQGLGAGPYIERGAYYLEQGMVSRAIEQLQKAIELEPENTDALLYLATALRVSGRHSEARQYISKAMSLQPEEPLILLEAVLLEIETKNYTEAEKLLNKVLSTATDPEVISDAKEYLEILRTQRPKHYGLSISGGAFYDTNVILEPEGINTGEEKDDWATAGNLSAWYGLWPQGPITIYGQYNLFQSIYFNEKDYNLQEHTLSFAIQRPAKVFIPALLYDFKYQSLGGDKYGLYHILTASATVQETAHLKTDVLYSHTFRDMYDTTVSPSNSDRSGGVDTIKIIQSYRWDPERSVSVGLVYEIEDSDKPWWDRKSLGFIAEGSYD
ncbi:MAG: tetratricopeptide repeat protein, partial [Nitrospirae bacterium]